VSETLYCPACGSAYTMQPTHKTEEGLTIAHCYRCQQTWAIARVPQQVQVRITKWEVK